MKECNGIIHARIVAERVKNEFGDDLSDKIVRQILKEDLNLSFLKTKKLYP